MSKQRKPRTPVSVEMLNAMEQDAKAYLDVIAYYAAVTRGTDPSLIEADAIKGVEQIQSALKRNLKKARDYHGRFLNWEKEIALRGGVVEIHAAKKKK